jgi:hypothetical protein
MTMANAWRAVPLFGLVLFGPGCAPKAPPLAGTLTPVPVPRTELPPGYRRVIFRWSYADPDYRLRGEGVARIAPPDSVRLDLFLDGGLGAARAILIGNDLRLPDADFAERLLPPAPLMWASLGRLSLPPAADTTVRVDGDTLRADIGRDPVWRAAFVGGVLRRLERIDGGRLREWVIRDSAGAVHYDLPTARRTLDISVLRSEPVSDLDATIWR